ncbi:hypothetical protein Ahy_B05g079199 [Arachis hypogaea]|uniref:Ureide permease n=1 Tax=Arachis hypogaea TaxID=3818 RepID=A0A444Z962_ARAHY|nr:hypothetical protein Ahy_B05g079199 [Arachis hypogaea]
MDSKDFCAISLWITLNSESNLCTDLEMYLLESKAGAIVCMLLALFFLGTWPAILTLLERRGRLPQHTYLDYSLTNFLAALFIAFTVGQIGKSTPSEPNFLAQLAQDNWPSVLFAMGGGVVLSLGNLASQYAFAFVGLSVTEVITASITVVIVCLGSAVHSSNTADNKVKLSNLSSDYNAGSVDSLTEGVKPMDLESGGDEKIKAGTAVFLLDLEKRRAIKAAFNLATNDQWHTLKEGVPHLTVYTAFFYFSVSCFVIAIILNFIFLYHPVLNLPKSSLTAYLRDWDGRGWALLAGLLCGFGNGLQFMGGQAAGYAAADAVQALPLVSTFWGIVLFGEYRKSSQRTYMLLGSMLFMFIVAVAVLMASSGHRKYQ